MSRVDRKFIKSKDSKWNQYFKKLFSRNSTNGIENLFPSCPRCNSPLTCGFGDESGDWYLCKNCGEAVTFESTEE